MTDRPSYLGLLNAIAVGEARGERLLAAWAERTADTDLAATLRLVALREREHAAAFAKRIVELGFEVRERPDADFEARLACAEREGTDLERFERLLGYGGADDPAAGLARLFDDETIDAQTGALLGRFIAEERDSGRRLRAHYDRLVAAAPGRAATGRVEARLDALEGQIARLREFLERRECP